MFGFVVVARAPCIACLVCVVGVLFVDLGALGLPLLFFSLVSLVSSILLVLLESFVYFSCSFSCCDRWFVWFGLRCVSSLCCLRCLRHCLCCCCFVLSVPVVSFVLFVLLFVGRALLSCCLCWHLWFCLPLLVCWFDGVVGVGGGVAVGVVCVVGVCVCVVCVVGVDGVVGVVCCVFGVVGVVGAVVGCRWFLLWFGALLLMLLLPCLFWACFVIVFVCCVLRCLC